MEYTTLIGDNKIHQLQQELGSGTWPEFMQHDKTVEKYWLDLYTHFLKLQFALFENKTLVGVANSICLNWSGKDAELPDYGLDWAMEKANVDHIKGLKPNLLVGVQILINPNYQSRGISYKMLGIMKEIARSNGLLKIALPVRPTLKSEFPLIEIGKYMTWKNKNGLPYDPWIRVHVKDGGKIVKSCPQSMTIEGSVSDWEKWTGKKFPDSGDYIIKHALVPIRMNISQDRGIYIEPNVWIIHEII